MKRPSLRIIEIKGNVQHKNTENVFNKIIKEKFPNLQKDMHMKIQEAHRAPNRLDQKLVPLPRNIPSTKCTE